jgi:hypothetical protein
MNIENTWRVRADGYESKPANGGDIFVLRAFAPLIGALGGMIPTEIYDEMVLQFPAMYPESPNWTWINVHDGMSPSLDTISDLLMRYISSSEVIVLVHSELGIGVVLSKESAANYIAGYVLKHDIQASDPQFTTFVTISRYGVATGDA